MESRAGRFLEASAWIVGLVAVAFFGGVYPLLSGSRTYTAEEIGRIFGAITGALLIGLFLRWVVVRIRRGGRVLSPWILLVAVIVLVLTTIRRPELGEPAASALPVGSSALIEAPYPSVD